MQGDGSELYGHYAVRPGINHVRSLEDFEWGLKAQREILGHWHQEQVAALIKVWFARLSDTDHPIDRAGDLQNLEEYVEAWAPEQGLLALFYARLRCSLGGSDIAHGHLVAAWNLSGQIGQTFAAKFGGIIQQELAKFSESSTAA